MSTADGVLFYWLRVGDGGDYRKFDLDDEESVADELVEVGLDAGWSRCRGGIELKGFRGDNYISLYVGDSEANYVRDLSGAQYAELRRRFRRAR